VRVLVSDASILIELARWSLLRPLFQLPFEFAVPDALYEDELIDLGDTDRQELRNLGLRVESLDPEGMAQAMRYQQARPRLTLNDCLAVTLAATRDWALLTGDKRMRALADEERIEVHGVLWVLDRLADHRVVDRDHLTRVLRGMLDDPRSRLPTGELRRRLHGDWPVA
jgi:predicted nucleic acid-binding protein